MSTTISRDTVITSQRFVTYKFEHSKLVCQRPGLRFVNPHQWCVQYELLVHSQVQRHVKRLDESIPAIGITAEIGLRHPRHNMINPPLAGVNGGYTQENRLRPGTKVFGKLSAGFSWSISMPASVNELCPSRPIKETSITSNSTPALRAMALAKSTSF